MPEAAIEFTVVTDDAGFQGLEDDWRRLSDAADPSHFFQTFDWCWQAWQCVSSKLARRLRLLVGRVGGQVVLIWPLVVAGPFLRVFGSDLFELHDVPVLPGLQRNIWLKAALRAAKRLGGAAKAIRDVTANRLHPGSKLQEDPKYEYMSSGESRVRKFAK